MEDDRNTYEGNVKEIVQEEGRRGRCDGSHADKDGDGKVVRV